MLHRLGLALLSLLASLSCTLAQADVFLLHQGGQIRGLWINRDESTASVYQIQTSAGRVTIAKDRVAEVIVQRPEQIEHERLAPLASDTIEGQWAIAEWCRERNLRAERETHLRRILELDPDHVKARLALGYMHIGGRWVTREGRLQEMGYEFYRGRWRLVQEIELLENRAKYQQAENEWRGKLKRLREALSNDASGKVYQQILAIRDPRAVPALHEHLVREPLQPVRLLYVEVLGGVASPEAIQSLVTFSVDHPDEEVRAASLEQLSRNKPPGLADPYIRWLKDSNPLRVNRAAIALAYLDERTAIEPLIEALVTVHDAVIRTGGSSDAVSTSFSHDSAAGGGSSFVAGARTEVVRQMVQNQDVLAALTRLTRGPSFGFNQEAWRNWYAIEKARLQSVNARRDAEH